MAKVDNCAKCLLPSNYPGISFHDGVCNFCKETEENCNHKIEYLGVERLKEDVKNVLDITPDRNEKYDAIIGFSGGMDSTYLLNFLVKELKLKVLAVTLMHKFMPKETVDNIEKVCKKLNVDIKYVHNKYLDECADFFITKWSFHPTYKSLISFCTGCRYGISKLLPDVAIENNIPLFFTGDTPYEKTDYKKRLVMLNPAKPSVAGLALGYSKELLKNPRYLTSIRKLFFQVKEMLSKNGNLKYLKDNNVYVFKPFFNYIEWEESKVKTVLNELEWKQSERFAVTWRSDCYINIVRQYYYKRMLGFNDVDVKNAEFLRKELYTIDDIKLSSDYDENVIRDILHESFNLDFDLIESTIKKSNK